MPKLPQTALQGHNGVEAEVHLRILQSYIVASMFLGTVSKFSSTAFLPHDMWEGM